MISERDRAKRVEWQLSRPVIEDDLLKLRPRVIYVLSKAHALYGGKASKFVRHQMHDRLCRIVRCRGEELVERWDIAQLRSGNVNVDLHVALPIELHVHFYVRRGELYWPRPWTAFDEQTTSSVDYYRGMW